MIPVELSPEDRELLTRTTNDLVAAFHDAIGSAPMLAVMEAAGSICVHAAKVLAFEQPQAAPLVREYLDSLPRGLDEPLMDPPMRHH